MTTHSLPGIEPEVTKSAVFSPCGTYRYTLTRGVGHGTDSVNFILLNPSTADSESDDPTIRRCFYYVKDWGYADLVVTNLFALRSTDPRALRTHPAPIGPENDRHLVEQARRATVVVCGWGVHGHLMGRSAEIARLLAGAGVTLRCLALTGGGEPGHPLYLSKDLIPRPWEGPTP